MPLHDLESGMSDQEYTRLLMENLKMLNRKPNRVSADTPTPAFSEFLVPHGLGFVPTGYALVTKSAPVNVYDSDTPHDKTNLHLKADAAGVTITLDISGGEVA